MGLGIPHSKNSLSLLMVSKYSIEGYMRLRKKILCGGHGYPPSDAYFGRDTETTRLSREREREQSWENARPVNWQEKLILTP
jgi:hypothetical protein